MATTPLDLHPDDVELSDQGSPTEGTAAGAGRLDGVPQFARDNVDWSGVKEVKAPPQKINDKLAIMADVPRDSKTIEVRSPEQYSAPVRAHESTHIAQDAIEQSASANAPMLARAQDWLSSKAAVAKSYLQGDRGYGVHSLDAYDYGGAQGLIDKWNRHESPGTLSKEQQAKAAQDYVESSRGLERKLREGRGNHYDLEEYDKLQRAYHPLVRALEPQPKDNTIDTHPAAPGLPDAAEAGYMAPEKGMGGGYTMPGKPVSPYALGGKEEYRYTPEKERAAIAEHFDPLKHFVKPGDGSKLSTDDAQKYLVKAKGNKDVARAMAKHDNHTF